MSKQVLVDKYTLCSYTCTFTLLQSLQHPINSKQEEHKEKKQNVHKDLKIIV